MAATAPALDLGRVVFGLSAMAFGLVALAAPDYYAWLQLTYTNAQIGLLASYIASAAQIAGGAAIAFPATAKTGAIILGAVYLAIALLGVPQIVATPLAFAPWGDFFEEFALVTGALIVFARSSSWGADTTVRIGRMLLGICTVSFGLYQAFYPDGTNVLVPKWLPPSQLFWTIVTTMLFELAALAILIDRMALLATQLLTLMIVLFGLIVWVPLIFAHPRSHTNWTETALNFAIAGTAWILADLLDARRRQRKR